MQHADSHKTWPEWLDDNTGADDVTKLAALREYIFDKATYHVGSGDFGGDWADKKLAKLGITERIGQEHAYEISAPVTATISFRVYARTRAEALEKHADRMRALNDSAQTVSGIVLNPAAGAPKFITGPEDPDVAAADPATPATVDDTLTALREIIMLGHVSGPKFCADGANHLLAFFGLAPLPETKSFTVTQPVAAVATTTVTAYDQETAARIAGWRWDDGRSGYQIREAAPTADAVVQDAVHA